MSNKKKKSKNKQKNSNKLAENSTLNSKNLENLENNNKNSTKIKENQKNNKKIAENSEKIVSKDLEKVFLKRNFYTIKDSGKIYLYALILPLVAGLIFGYIGMAIASGSGIEFPEGSNIIRELFNQYLWFSIPFSLLTQIVFIVIFFGYNGANRIQQKACKISFKKANFWTCVLSAVVGIVCVLGLLCLIEGSFGAFFKAIGLKSSALGLKLDTVGWYFANLLILGVAPAICEEIIFRGVIFQGLKEKYSAIGSIFLSSLLFALMHQNIQQFIYPFILGCLFAFVFHKTNNLLYPILIHLFNNVTTITLTYLNNIGVINLNFKMTWWFIVVSILLAIVTFVILWLLNKFYFKKQKKIQIENEGEVSQTPAMAVGKMPLTLVFGIVVAVIMIVLNAM